MIDEINSTIHFLSDLLRVKGSLAPETVLYFAGFLQDAMTQHYKDHWFPDIPLKGSAYRCIRINGILDPLVARAVKCAGLVKERIHGSFPDELTIWVDPGEVTYRIGENGSVGHIYPPSNPSSMFGQQFRSQPYNYHQNDSKNNGHGYYQCNSNPVPLAFGLLGKPDPLAEGGNKRFHMNSATRDHPNYSASHADNTTRKNQYPLQNYAMGNHDQEKNQYTVPFPPSSLLKISSKNKESKKCFFEVKRRDSSHKAKPNSDFLSPKSNDMSYDGKYSSDKDVITYYFPPPSADKTKTRSIPVGRNRDCTSQSIMLMPADDTDYGSYSSSSSFSSLSKLGAFDAKEIVADVSELPGINNEVSKTINPHQSEENGYANFVADNKSVKLRCSEHVPSKLSLSTLAEYYNVQLCSVSATRNAQAYKTNNMDIKKGLIQSASPACCCGGPVKGCHPKQLNGVAYHSNMVAHPHEVIGGASASPRPYYPTATHAINNPHHPFTIPPYSMAGTGRCCCCRVKPCSLTSFVSRPALNKFYKSNSHNNITNGRLKVANAASACCLSAGTTNPPNNHHNISNLSLIGNNKRKAIITNRSAELAFASAFLDVSDNVWRKNQS